MQGLDRYFGVHADALRLRSQRLDLIASNIANAATPNYKARDLDFAAALDAASHGNTAAPLYRIPVQPSADGNTVELATEQTEFAENAVAYQATLAFLGGRISTLMTAIKGE